MEFPIKFEKTQMVESEKDKQVKLVFGGMSQNIDCVISLKGDDEDMKKFMEELNISKYGQRLKLNVFNDQTTLE